MNLISPKLERRLSESENESDLSEYELKKAFILVELDVLTNTTKVININDNLEDVQTFLLEHINNIPPSDLSNQFCLMNKNTIEYYKRGYIYGKTLQKKYIINSYEY